jgi:membrane-associated protease RseP (regulator of RpoE activity)
MSMSQLRGAVEWALMVGLVFGAGAVAQANNDETQVEDRVIQIGPADADAANPVAGGGVAVDPNGAPRELPKYWIGMLGEPVTPDLRHHVDIPENEGLIIRQIVPDSPAAKAGLEQYDIVLRANDTVLHEMSDLVELVRSEGEKKTQITLEVLRHGSRETVYVTPEERPAHVAQSSGPGIGGGLDGGVEGLPPGLQQFFGRGAINGGAPFEFRHFGPGMIGRGGGVAAMPNGVSVSIQKQEGQPTHITVQRGEETWEVVGDDPKSLEQLPEDLRPFVTQMLDGGLGNFQIDMPDLGRPGRPGFDGEQLRERLEAMERRLEAMQERLLGDEAAEKPAAEPTK